MRLVAGIVLLAAVSLSSPSLADVRCVQDGLTDLGFSPGPVDGALGKRTVRAATIFATNADLTLPTLEKANSDLWCAAIAEFAATPAAKNISIFDIASVPDDILSERDTQRQWDLYKTAGECFKGADIAPGADMKLALRTPEQFSSADWKSPFTPVSGAAECRLMAGGLVMPRPMVKITLDESYGARVFDMDSAAQWFRRLATYARFSNDPVARSLVKDGVLSWARGNALSSGIRVSWGNRPVDYQVMATIISILAATAEIAADFTGEEKVEVGTWLNGLVAESLVGYSTDRQDNKAYMRAYMATLWGIMVDDDEAIQAAIDIYKTAIHDMRPDGSWPVDSQRGGMGLVYNGAATAHLTLIAVALQQNLGLDLFSYAVDGRSIHDAVDFVAAAVKDPEGANAKYAISCPDGGDRFGSVDKPTHFFITESAGFLTAYAHRFPERESSRYLLEALPGLMAFDGAMDTEKDGGAPACQYALLGGEVSLEPLTMPEPPPPLPVAEFEVRTTAEIESAQPRDMSVDAHLVSVIRDASDGEDLLDFNLQGTYDFKANRFASLKMVIGFPLSKDEAVTAGTCRVELQHWDDKGPRLTIFLDPKGKGYVARDFACIEKAVAGRVGFQARFLIDNFDDVAIGMLESGDVESIVNEGLKTFMRDVALGEVSVTR